MKKEYYLVLFWQALCIASTFWIPEIGWIYFIGGLILCYLSETILAQYAKNKGLQRVGTPFKSAKYAQSQALMIIQLCFTIVLWIVSLILISSNSLWKEFWILLGLGILLFLVFCFFLQPKRSRR